MNDSVVYKKSFEFAIKIVNLYKNLTNKKEFVSKMSIASKEARETKYWLDLLKVTNYLNKEDFYILKDIHEIIKILTSIIKTLQENERKL